MEERCRVLAVVLLALATGCAAPDKSTQPLRVQMTLDRETYRIGDPIVATVAVYNMTRKGITLGSFDTKSVSFYVNEKGGIRRNAHPVEPKGMESEERLVKSFTRVKRSFVFTRITDRPGARAIIARVANCAGEDERLQETGAWFGPAVEFTVTEEVGLKRDPHSGVLTKDQVVALARQYIGVPADVHMRAVLVPLEGTGLVDWAVYITHGGMNTACWINAYTGAMRALERDRSKIEGEKR